MKANHFCVSLLVHVSSSNCCYTFVEKRISLQKIQCYRNTSSTCPYQKSLM